MPQSVLLVLGRRVYREWSGHWMIGVEDVGNCNSFGSSERLSHEFDETASGGVTNKRRTLASVLSKLRELLGIAVVEMLIKHLYGSLTTLTACSIKKKALSHFELVGG
jgi:hypothetical protein